MISAPDRRRSLGDTWVWLNLDRDQERWLRLKAQRLKVFAFEVKCDRFLEVGDRLVQRLALRYDADSKALGNVIFLAAPDVCLDGLLECSCHA